MVNSYTLLPNVLLFGCILAQFVHTKHFGQNMASISMSSLIHGSVVGEQSLPRMHVLIPASRRDVNLCKLLVGATLLGYPTPTLTGWEMPHDQPGLLGGGSHVAKVSGVLNYLNTLPSTHEDDFVLMLDAYDIHLQLPASTLLERYRATSEAARQRLFKNVGEATVTAHALNQTILFGAGKRCAPNQPHTIACYPLPESPLPPDLYGPNTDTIIGHNHWWSNRQRYLNSGYVLGPVGPMRRMFKEAWRRIQEHPDQDPEDDGSHGSDFMYHGSDQSIFAAMYGRQEWTREKLRVDASAPGTRPRAGSILGTTIDNVLDPSFTHEKFDVDVSRAGWWHEFDYGIHLDFWSDVGHQSINSEADGQWIRYDSEDEVDVQVQPRHRFDCPINVPKRLPKDVVGATCPADKNLTTEWTERPLYTHLCLGRVPALIHMNGIKEHREQHWPLLWYQASARAMIEGLAHSDGRTQPAVNFDEHRLSPKSGSVVGAWSDSAEFLSWDRLCPSDFASELFRGT